MRGYARQVTMTELLAALHGWIGRPVTATVSEGEALPWTVAVLAGTLEAVHELDPEDNAEAARGSFLISLGEDRGDLVIHAHRVRSVERIDDGEIDIVLSPGPSEARDRQLLNARSVQEGGSNHVLRSSSSLVAPPIRMIAMNPRG